MKYWPLLIIVVLILVIIYWDKIRSFFMKEKVSDLSLTEGQATLNLQNLLSGRNLQIDTVGGAYALDIDSTGCLIEKNPRVLVPNGISSPILEVKANYTGCPANAGRTPTWVRTIYGWFSLESEGLQII